MQIDYWIYRALLQIQSTLESRDMQEQLLDNLDIERERGITIKLQAARIHFKAIDTPGHVDFGYEGATQCYSTIYPLSKTE